MIPIEFPHLPPPNHSYEFEEFKHNVVVIWIHNHNIFDYNLGKPVKSVWGFYSKKTKSYYSPVNSKTIGEYVRIGDTSPYSAMQIKQTPLQQAFV